MKQNKKIYVGDKVYITACYPNTCHFYPALCTITDISFEYVSDETCENDNTEYRYLLSIDVVKDDCHETITLTPDDIYFTLDDAQKSVDNLNKACDAIAGLI